MREIKFRAWRKNKKSMAFRGVFDRNWYTDPKGGKCMDGIHPSDKNTMEVMQYTGLKDKNGAEIYEGDILESTIFICPVHVDYFDELAMYRLSARGDDCGDFIEYEANTFEVIGNIYETPELLK